MSTVSGQVPGQQNARSLREVRAILRYRKVAAFHRVVGRLPAARRDRVLRPACRVAGWLADRRPGDTLFGPVAFILRWETGQTTRALEQLHASMSLTSPRGLIRYARVCVAIGRLDEAGPLIEHLPDDERAELPVEMAFAAGRYRDVLAQVADTAGHRRDMGGRRRLAARAAAELRVLDPAWRPTLPPRSIDGWELTRGRILHLLTNSLPQRQNGYSVRAQQIARAQREVGLDPHMVTRAGFPLSDGKAGAPSRDLVEGIPYYRISPDMALSGTPDVQATATAAGLDALVAELRPAVIHPTTNYPNAQVALAIRDRYPVKVVYEVRGFLEETWVSRSGSSAAVADRYLLGRAVETACMAAADAVVTLSETMKADIVARGIAPDHVVVIPNAVDTSKFNPRPRDDGLAAHLGIERGEVVLGYISSMVSYEGITYLLQAARILRDRGRRVRVLLVGDGEERGALVDEARTLGLLKDGTVRFTGRVPHDEVAAYYSIIDIFVVPRTNDRVSQLVTPLKPYEAMAMQRCLVVSGVGALLEIVSHGETGVSFVPEDPVSLADTIEPLLDDPTGRARLGAAAREWVLAHRTWTRNAGIYRDLYDRLGVV